MWISNYFDSSWALNKSQSLSILKAPEKYTGVFFFLKFSIGIVLLCIVYMFK